jgi:hypothetical protein
LEPLPWSGFIRCQSKGILSHALSIRAAILVAASQPSFAQAVLKSEPLYLAPNQVAYVSHVSCEGKLVLRVTGSMRHLPRKKVCVAIGRDQAALSRGTLDEQ